MIQTSNPHWLAHLSLLWHGTSVLFHGEIPHFGVKSLTFWPLKPPNFYIKPYQPSMLACFNSQFSMIFPHLRHIDASFHSSLELPMLPPEKTTTFQRRDARPVVAQWTARCPCERPPNTKMRGLAEFHGVTKLESFVNGFWINLDKWGSDKWQTWRCYHGFYMILYDVLEDLNGEWNLKGFQWSVEWKYMGNIMTM